MEQHVARVEDRTTSTNPLLFARRRAEERSDDEDEEDIERSTALATRVMKTFGDESIDESNAT
jgi:hypothetical protein